MSEWQTMETAPKDGSVVDLWSPNEVSSHDEGFPYRNARGNRATGYWHGDGWWHFPVTAGFYRDKNGGSPIYAPTHWMPLPEPPK